MTQSIDEALTKIGAQFDSVLRGTLFDLASRTIKDTQVDTGRLRSNWQANTTGFEDGEKDIRSEAEVGSEVADVAGKLDHGDTFYFFNNVPYAGYQEEQRQMLGNALNALLVRLK